MVRPITNRRGYTLLEVLIVVLILSSMAVVSLSKNVFVEVEHYEFMNEYLKGQIEAMVNREYVHLDNGIYFNENGHVNMANTYCFDRHKVISHLGNGYLSYE
ncbi:MAG: prepilin-type N-terminal cleavage/methylation domain-containing protein [Erysipelotrichaceae bacterium]|nr:prepilin-type N-terminal cleavage/methylation domain-containing protein [Erysipelotrichaceae bacterium]